ncbi:MAG: DUF1320 family protein [Magnetococcales bacterium]|nr:DUF1320 family protein [Magnetococcales bacterium]
MSYATADHLLLWFGAGELTEVAVPDDRPTISAELLRLTIAAAPRTAYGADECLTADLAVSRLQTALAEGSRLLDSYLAARYPLPLPESVIAASPLPRACCVLALTLLYDDQLPKAVTQRQQQVIQWLQALTQGVVELAPPLAQSGRVANGPSHASGPRVFDDNSLREFMR